MKDFLIGFAIALFALVLIFGGLGSTFMLVDRAVDNSWKPVVQKETQQLTTFLKEHGDVVTIVHPDEELDRARSGKQYETVRSPYHLCRFKDGYTIEVYRLPHSSTRRIPLYGETWRLEIGAGSRGAYLYLAQYVYPTQP